MEEQNETRIHPRDLTENKIKALSEQYAHSALSQFRNEGKNIIYTIAGLLYFDNAYYSLQIRCLHLNNWFQLSGVYK
jgi:hypothetical protein